MQQITKGKPTKRLGEQSAPDTVVRTPRIRKRPRTDKQEFYTIDEAAEWYAITVDAMRKWSEREAVTQPDGERIAKLGHGVVGFQARMGMRWLFYRAK